MGITSERFYGILDAIRKDDRYSLVNNKVIDDLADCFSKLEAVVDAARELSSEYSAYDWVSGDAENAREKLLAALAALED